MGVHNADSAESSLHTLLAYPTALLSSLISPVNASPRLIENELAPWPLEGGGGAYVPEPRTDTPSNAAGEASEDLLPYAKNSLHRQINQYTLECRGTIPRPKLCYFHPMPKTGGLINQEYAGIKNHT